MTKEKHASHIVYALADYKQLVLAYKTKYTELVKKVTFWRTSALWLIFLMLSIGLVMFFDMAQNRSRLTESKGHIVRLSATIETISQKQEKLQQEFEALRRESDKKDMVIRQLEQNVSNASKKLLEKLLVPPKNNQ
jgi:septal ring factor EnvC (AmiA/AmiB activator)